MAHTQLSSRTKVSVGIAAVALVGLGAYGFAFLLQDESTFRADVPRSSSPVREAPIDTCLNKCVDGTGFCLSDPRQTREMCERQQVACEEACRVEFSQPTPPVVAPIDRCLNKCTDSNTTCLGIQGNTRELCQAQQTRCEDLCRIEFTPVPPPVPVLRVYEIQTQALGPAWVNKSYRVLLEAKNIPVGASARWAVTSGRLPEGIKLGASDGILSGIATETGSFPIRITVSSAEGSGSQDFVLLVNPEDRTAPPTPGRSTITIPTTLDATVITAPMPIATLVIVTDGALPEARVRQSYNVTLRTGALPVPAAPVTWNVESGRFPEGVKLNENSGIISGIPTEPGRYPLRIRAQNGSAYGIKEFVLVVMAEETIAPPSVPPVQSGPRPIVISGEPMEATVNQRYSSQFMHGTLPFPGSPMRWSVIEGRLPEGVKLGDQDGILDGIPTEVGMFPVRIRFENTVNAVGEKSFQFVVRPPAPTPLPPSVPPEVPPVVPPTPTGPTSLQVSPEILPVGTVGQAYSQRLQAVNANRSLIWRLVTGTLPAGLELGQDGVLSGTPTVAGQTLLSIRGSDNAVAASETVYAARQYVLTIEAGRPQLMIAASSPLPDTRVGVAYQHQPLAVSGGVQPYVWRIESGRLPDGLTLNQVTGMITGTATETGTFPIRVRVGDAAQGIVSDDFRFTVLPALASNPPVTNPPTGGTPVTPPATVPAFAVTGINAMPNGTVGDNYSYHPLNVTGGRAPYQWSVTTGQAPSGLNLDASGTFTGVPSSARVYQFTLQVRDADGRTLSADFTVTINARPQYNPVYTNDPQWPIRVNRVNDMGLRVHDLIKLVDDNNPDTQYDTTVYYVGADGRRHAFPNAKVYFTWFSDYSGVRVVLPRQLADIPLGPNITYRPGVRLVKFVTDPRVYAVDTQRRLRWVTTEQAARDLYGVYWNQNVDDISDAFYMDYRFDAPAISSRSQFDPDGVRRAVGYPSEVLP